MKRQGITPFDERLPAVEFIPVVAMAALTYKVVDFLRYLRAGDSNGVLTQLAAWIGGIFVTVLVAQTDFADAIPVGDLGLGQLNFWSLVFVGLTAGSAASIGKDTLKAVDNTNSAVMPTLIAPRARHRSTAAATPTATEENNP